MNNNKALGIFDLTIGICDILLTVQRITTGEIGGAILFGFFACVLIPMGIYNLRKEW